MGTLSHELFAASAQDVLPSGNVTDLQLGVWLPCQDVSHTRGLDPLLPVWPGRLLCPLASFSSSPCLLLTQPHCPQRSLAAPLTAAGTSSTAAWLAVSGTLSSASRLSWGCWGRFARSWRIPSAHPMSPTARTGPFPGHRSPRLSPVDIGRMSIGTGLLWASPQGPERWPCLPSGPHL